MSSTSAGSPTFPETIPSTLRPTPNIETWANLRAFAEWYLKFQVLRPRPPAIALRGGPGSSGMIIFRRGAFQVEFVRFAPGHNVPPHCHPNVSCYDVHLSGSGLIELAGRMLRPRPPIADPMKSRVPVLAGVVHSGEAGPDGAEFLSLQHWHSGEATGFIVDDWRDA